MNEISNEQVIEILKNEINNDQFVLTKHRESIYIALSKAIDALEIEQQILYAGDLKAVLTFSIENRKFIVKEVTE